MVSMMRELLGLGREMEARIANGLVGRRAVAATVASLALAVAASTARADLASEIAPLVGADGVAYAVAEDGAVLVDIRGDTPFVPASTIKVLTCLVAIKELGSHYRFKTEIYDAGELLVVRGRGDPLLVSEEVERIASALAGRVGDKQFGGVAIDDSYFGGGVSVPGVGRSDNPYDAPNSATSVNFNTINVKRVSGEIVSAERQTPLTPTAVAAAQRRGVDGETRIRLGDSPGDVQRYAGEVFAAKLRESRIPVGPLVMELNAPRTVPLYVHANSRTLGEACRMMLRYSNNYIANQIFLVLGAEKLGEPAAGALAPWRRDAVARLAADDTLRRLRRAAFNQVLAAEW